MKKYITILMLIAVISSCKKTGTTEPLTDETGTVIGRWELRKSICGWGGSADFPAGNGTIITFNNSGQYTATGRRVDSGVYRLSTRTNGQGQMETILYLGGNWNQEFRFSITGNIFKLDENAFAYDGCEYNYQKLP